MILSELIAKLGELYLSQGDVRVEVSDGNESWELDDFSTGAAMGWVFLISQSLHNALRDSRNQLQNKNELILIQREEIAKIRAQLDLTTKEYVKTQDVQRSIIANWTSIDTNYVDIT